MRKCRYKYGYVLLFIIIFLSNLIISEETTSRFTMPSFDDFVTKYLSNGEMNDAYLSYNQYLIFIKEITDTYSSILSLSSIGQTYESNEIPIITFKSNKPSNQGILFTGMHHAREPLSMMMNLYILLKILSDYHIITPLVKHINIYFIPIINIDSYKYNCEMYTKTKNLDKCLARKNRNINSTIHCKGIGIGIDLNRNYDYKFGIDNQGSSNSPCEEDYRGPTPFSEPETIAIRNFLLEHKDVKIAINYHSWGNLLIIPFNYASSIMSETVMKKKFPLQYTVYQEIYAEGHYPDKILFGNGQKTINYKANGDGSDWMLGALGIVAFSPELGTEDNSTNVFYPDKNLTFHVLKENMASALYAIQKVNYYLKLNNTISHYSTCKGEHLLAKTNCTNESDIIITHQLNVMNTGFGKYYKETNLKIYATIDHKDIDLKKITLWKNIGKSLQIVYENKNFNDTSLTNQEIAIDLNVDIDSRKETVFYIEIISDKVMNISYHIDKTMNDWKYNKPLLHINALNFTLKDTNKNFEDTNAYNSKDLFIQITLCIALFIIIILIVYYVYIVKRKYITSNVKQQSNQKIEIDIGQNSSSNKPSSYIEMDNIPIPTSEIS